MTAGPPFRVAIVGAGPSGFYAAGQLLAVDEPQFSVDLYDRLPTPYGLIRSGVHGGSKVSSTSAFSTPSTPRTAVRATGRSCG